MIPIDVSAALLARGVARLVAIAATGAGTRLASRGLSAVLGPRAVTRLTVPAPVADPRVRRVLLVVVPVAAALVAAALVAAAARRSPRFARRAQAITAAVTWMTGRPLRAVVISRGPPVPAPPGATVVLEVPRIPSSPVPDDQKSKDQDNHDNSEGNQELSHRTIHRGMASQCGASEAHAAIDADLTQ